MSPIPVQVSAPVHNSITDTSVQQAQTNTLFAVQAQVANMNAARKTDYLTQFQRWADQVSAGRIDASEPPIPPRAYIVGSFTDPTTADQPVKIDWPYPALGTDPVCDMPPIPTVAPPAVQVHSAGNESVMNVPPGDTFALGTVLTDPNGEKWQKVSRPTPWGNALLYLHIPKAS